MNFICQDCGWASCDFSENQFHQEINSYHYKLEHSIVGEDGIHVDNVDVFCPECDEPMCVSYGKGEWNRYFIMQELKETILKIRNATNDLKGIGIDQFVHGQIVAYDFVLNLITNIENKEIK